jgi:hypothetical protein
MNEIINQLATEMNCKVEEVTNVTVYEDKNGNLVRFDCFGTWWVKLYKNGKAIRKNSLRKETW